jgi:SAM-dependent methyltransferase
LVFVYPKPSFDEIAGFYANYHAETGQMELSQGGEQCLFQEVLKHISRRASRGEVLDIGASYGHFLDMARKQGYAVKGVEIAAEPCRYAREVLNLDIECLSLLEARFETGRFAAITMLNVLEHLSDPQDILNECWRIAQAGGVIAIVVPNVLLTYPYFVATRRLGLEVRVPGSAFDVPAHLSLFSSSSLRWMLQAAGWDNIWIANAPVIRNQSRLRTAVKQCVKWLGDGVSNLTGNRLVYGYSLLAIASKPASRNE